MDSGYDLSDNRIGWAMSYLTMATALRRPKWAHYVITAIGRELAQAHPGGVTERTLRDIPAYRERRELGSDTKPGRGIIEAQPELDPIEQLEAGTARIRQRVATELLDRLREQGPSFLEQSVLDVLVAMGYGGADGQARRIGGTGDGGLDGCLSTAPA